MTSLISMTSAQRSIIGRDCSFAFDSSPSTRLQWPAITSVPSASLPLLVLNMLLDICALVRRPPTLHSRLLTSLQTPATGPTSASTVGTSSRGATCSPDTSTNATRLRRVAHPLSRVVALRTSRNPSVINAFMRNCSVARERPVVRIFTFSLLNYHFSLTFHS